MGMKKQTIEDFRDTGLLLFVNSFLHIFGWSIIVEKSGPVTKMYPARTTWRGFSEEDSTEAYKKVSKYMVNAGRSLLADIEGDGDQIEESQDIESKIVDGFLCYCWEDEDIFSREMRFYDKINKTSFTNEGERNGYNYSNFIPVRISDWPEWAVEAHKSLPLDRKDGE